MLVLGLQGSPRRRGNTYYLLSSFLSEAERLGARTRLLEVDRMQVVPCKEYVVCEKRGYCPIEDDVRTDIYPLLRAADVIVAGTPVFFYNMTAQLKAVIDRCQVFWSRKYRLGLHDPKHRTKRGLLLSVAATRGKKLFDAIDLTLRNFYDALDTAYVDRLVYREIEGPKDMSAHPTVSEDVRLLAEKWVGPLLKRRRVLFVDPTGAGLGQMAAALAEDRHGDRLEAACAGLSPAAEVNRSVVEAMAAAGIDLGFRAPALLEDVLMQMSPDTTVVLEGAALPDEVGGEHRHWDLPPGAPPSELREALGRRIDELAASAPTLEGADEP